MARRPTKQTNSERTTKPLDDAKGTPLAAKVRQSLLAVLDGDGAAAAKASASRTLLEWFGSEKAGPQKPLSEWSVAEIDAEIERVSRLTRLTAVRE
jgi:hypothetical protein